MDRKRRQTTGVDRGSAAPCIAGLAALVKKKAKGQKIEILPEAAPGAAKVVNIMDALKWSLKEAPAPAKKRAAR